MRGKKPNGKRKKKCNRNGHIKEIIVNEWLDRLQPEIIGEEQKSFPLKFVMSLASKFVMLELFLKTI